MKSEFTIKKLDTSNDVLVEKYEKALFASFYDPDNILQKQIRIIDVDNKRMRPVIPYEHLEIYYGEVENEIISGVAMHFNSFSKWELELCNFTEFEKSFDTCEVFCLFNNRIFHNGELIGLRLDKFSKMIFSERNMSKVYAGCYAQKLKAYKTLGWVEKEEKKIDEDVIFLLELTL